MNVTKKIKTHNDSPRVWTPNEDRLTYGMSKAEFTEVNEHFAGQKLMEEVTRK